MAIGGGQSTYRRENHHRSANRVTTLDPSVKSTDTMYTPGATGRKSNAWSEPLQCTCCICAGLDVGSGVVAGWKAHAPLRTGTWRI